MAEMQTSPHIPIIAASSAKRQCRADVSCLESSSFTSDENDTCLPSSLFADVGTYAKIVSEKAALRRLIRVNEEIASACYAGKDSVEEIMEDTEKKIFQVLQRKTNDEFVPIKDVVLNALDKIEAASRMKGSVTWRNAAWRPA